MEFFRGLFYVSAAFGFLSFGVMALFLGLESLQRIKIAGDKYKRELR